MSKQIDSLYPKYGCSGKIDWDTGGIMRGQLAKDTKRQLRVRQRRRDKQEIRRQIYETHNKE